MKSEPAGVERRNALCIRGIAYAHASDAGDLHPGQRALPFSYGYNELLDECRACWMRDPAWRQRGIALPALADLETWELFVRAVEETGHPRLGTGWRGVAGLAEEAA